MSSVSARRSVAGEMRTPIRSETEAFRFAIGTVLVIVLAALIGWLTAPLAGVATLMVAIAAAAIAYLRAANPDRQEPLRRAALAAHPHGGAPGKRHVLVIANEPLAGRALRERIVGQGDEEVELDILAPVLISRLHYGVSDIDRERERARVRLQRSLRWAREQGITARGEVGDPSATTAIEDELRDFGADEVVVITHPRERQGWQERTELERLGRELDVPITQLVTDGAGAPDDLESSANEESGNER